MQCVCVCHNWTNIQFHVKNVPQVTKWVELHLHHITIGASKEFAQLLIRLNIFLLLWYSMITDKDAQSRRHLNLEFFAKYLLFNCSHLIPGLIHIWIVWLCLHRYVFLRFLINWERCEDNSVCKFMVISAEAILALMSTRSEQPTESE